MAMPSRKSRSPAFVYAVPPIDHWPNTHHLSDVLSKLARQDEREAAKVLLQFADAVAHAHHSSWEGEIREGPFLLILPGDIEMEIAGFIWKQDNNGTTFVVSRVELPYLSEFLEYRA